MDSGFRRTLQLESIDFMGVAGRQTRELAVAREREVVGRRLADLDPLPRAVLLGEAAQRSALRRGAAAPDVALAGLQLAEHHVERAHVARVVAGVGEREQREQPVEVSVGGLAVHDEVGRERGVDQASAFSQVGVALVVGSPSVLATMPPGRSG